MDHEQSAANARAEEGAQEPEVVDGVLVVADVRAVQSVREGPPPFVQVAAVAATGFMAGAATAAVFGRRLARQRLTRAPRASFPRSRSSRRSASSSTCTRWPGADGAASAAGASIARRARPRPTM